MRLVFTKLDTPKKNILVDLGTGEFEEFSLQELEDSETGRYLQLPDIIPTNSIRVKTNSAEFGSFDMIKEYQITDDEGNWVGGNIGGGTSEIEIKDIKLCISEMSGKYMLDTPWQTKHDDDDLRKWRFFESLQDSLYYFESEELYWVKELVEEATVRQADGKLLYLNTGGKGDELIIPVPLRVKLVEIEQDEPTSEQK